MSIRVGFVSTGYIQPALWAVFDLFIANSLKWRILHVAVSMYERKYVTKSSKGKVRLL
jgi:hypothetical protein